MHQSEVGGSVRQSRSWRYDPAGRLVEQTTGGVTTGYSYHGTVVEKINADGSRRVTEHYLDGQVKRVHGDGAVERSYSYRVSGQGHLVIEVDTAGVIERIEQDLLGRTVLQESAGRGTTRHVYDASGHLVSSRYPGRAAQLYEYDELGKEVRRGLDLDGSGALEADGNDPVSETVYGWQEDNGVLWRYERRYGLARGGGKVELSHVRRQASRLGTVEADGTLVERVQLIDALGNVTDNRRYIDRSSGTVTEKVRVPGSSGQQVVRRHYGQVVFEQTSTGVTTRYGYDGLGRLIRRSPERIGDYLFGYDEDGHLAWEQDPAGNRTQYGYDEAGRLCWQKGPGGRQTGFAYNGRGQLVRRWGSDWPVAFGYDGAGRPIEMVTFRQGDFDSGFDPGAAGDVTRWGYDPVSGLLAYKQYADGSRVSYAYDNAGRLVSRSWARGVETSYGYDNAGRLVSVSYSDGTEPIHYRYDRLGRLVEVEDAAGHLELGYDPVIGKKVSERRGATALDLSYDDLGRRSGLGLGELRLSYGYDGVGHLSTVSWQVAGRMGQAGWGYQADLVARRSLSWGVRSDYSYEAHRDLVSRVKSVFGTSTLSDIGYSNDAAGLRVSVKLDGVQASYSYNLRRELVKERYQGFASWSRDYSYDPIGNRTSAVLGQKAVSYVSNQLNQYVQAGDGHPVYDADGNLVSWGRWRFVYNGENRLVEAVPADPVEGDVSLRFVYDYLGRRVQKELLVYRSGAWQQEDVLELVYDGWNVVQQSSTSGRWYFVWGPDLSGSLQGAGGIGGLVCRVDESGSAQGYLYDANGNVIGLVDQSGKLVASYRYDGFGNLIEQDGPFAADNPWRFSTKYFDQQTGLYYYGYRYYLPEAGRWINRDPLGESGGYNLYAFVLNDPESWIDPFGLEFYDILPGIKKAIKEGLKAGTHSVYEAGKAIADIAVSGDPFAQTALGVAFVSEAVPLVSAAAITAAPSVISAAYLAAQYSPVISDAAQGFFVPGPPPASPGGYAGYAAKEFLEEICEELTDWNTNQSSDSNCP